MYLQYLSFCFRTRFYPIAIPRPFMIPSPTASAFPFALRQPCPKPVNPFTRKKQQIARAVRHVYGTIMYIVRIADASSLIHEKECLFDLSVSSCPTVPPHWGIFRWRVVAAATCFTVCCCSLSCNLKQKDTKANKSKKDPHCPCELRNTARFRELWSLLCEPTPRGNIPDLHGGTELNRLSLVAQSSLWSWRFWITYSSSSLKMFQPIINRQVVILSCHIQR